MSKSKSDIIAIANFFKSTGLNYDELCELNYDSPVYAERCRKVFRKAVKSNLYSIKKAVVRNVGDIKSLLSQKPLVDVRDGKFKLIGEAVLKLRLTEADLNGPCFSPDSAYGNLCVEIGIKNNLNNRKNLQSRWHRNKEAGKKNFIPTCNTSRRVFFGFSTGSWGVIPIVTDFEPPIIIASDVLSQPPKTPSTHKPE